MAKVNYMALHFENGSDEGVCEGFGTLKEVREVFEELKKDYKGDPVAVYLVKVIDDADLSESDGNGATGSVEEEGETDIVIEPPQFKPENSRLCSAKESCS